MSNLNRTNLRTEVKSKIGDYIRGKISAQSLMHPSRINTKPIDKRQYTLNTNTFNYHSTKTDYQRKTRRPPLKDYIEGKVKLSDMISPSKITSIPKERKYPTEVKRLITDVDENLNTKRNQSFDGSMRVVYDDVSKSGLKTEDHNWCVTSYRCPLTNISTKPSLDEAEYSLMPLKTMKNSFTGRKKFMCKIKRVQKTGENTSSSEETVTEERIIEVSEEMLRKNKNLPKFLMDHYNIPCHVNNKSPKRKEPPAILHTSSEDDVAVDLTKETLVTPCPNVEGGNSVVVDMREPVKTNADISGVPSEQGDYNNTTTYIFEFYEEDASQESKHATIEEIDDNSDCHQTRRSCSDKSKGGDPFCGMPRNEKYQSYEDFKSQILLQRELLDLHRGMLKCDKNVMVVERNVSQVTASLNVIESVQNREIKPVVLNMKTEHDNLKVQIESLQAQNQKLKSTLKSLHKKTMNYERLMSCMSHSSNTKFQELEKKLQTIALAQMKSIEMQNFVNKNMFKMTHQMKRTCSELDSKHCCSSVVKSPKICDSSIANANNLTGMLNDDSAIITSNLIE